MKVTITKADNGYIVKEHGLTISMLDKPYSATNLFVFKTLKEVFDWIKEQETNQRNGK